MASKDRLVGSDASLMKASFGSELVTGTATAGAWYKIEKRIDNVAEAINDTATSIRAGTFPGWTLTGATTDIIFTATATGVKTGANSLAAGDTGVAGTFVISTPGSVGVAEIITLTITAPCSAPDTVYISIRDGTAVGIAVTPTTGVFPAGYEVGDLWMGNGVSVFTAANSAKLATFTEIGDVTSFTLEYSADEIEVTVLADEVKKYRRGKADMSGTVEGINFVSEMVKPGSFVNRFMRTVASTALNVAVMNGINSDALYCQFFIQKDGITSGETQAFLFAQIDLFGTSLGAAIGDAQSWSSGLRIVGNDPILYFHANS